MLQNDVILIARDIITLAEDDYKVCCSGVANDVIALTPINAARGTLLRRSVKSE